MTGSVHYICDHTLYNNRIQGYWDSEVECPDCAVAKVMEAEAALNREEACDIACYILSGGKTQCVSSVLRQ